MSSARRTIGRFEIQRELGRGMMGIVYEAYDPRLTRTVALKTVSPNVAAGGEDREAFERRFESEARIAGGLSHPNIVVVHDVGRDDDSGVLYIALERLQGETLAELLKKGVRLDWRQVLDIGRQVADALHHAHAKGVVHRDVKPANIMLLPTGQAKLMDFGIAKVEASQLTAAGQFFGTPLFMCPEQASAGTVDGRGDIFSLGSVLYTLLTHRHAFGANSVATIIHRLMTEDPSPPSRLEPSLPPAVDYVVARCLAKSPAERYADAQQLAQDLGDILDGAAPRHQAGWRAPAPAGARGAGASAGSPAARTFSTLDVDLGEEALGSTRTLVAAERPQPEPPPGKRRPRLVLGAITSVWATAMAVGLLLPARVPGRSVDEAITERSSEAASTLAASARSALSSAAPEATMPAAAPVATPAPTPVPKRRAKARPKPPPPPAKVVVDFSYPIRSGTLRIWMDDEVVLGEAVRGRVDKDLLVVKLRSGVFTDVIKVEPGRHDFRVQVSWDDETRSERIPGLLHAGELYRLQIRLGRLKKDLSLEWTR
jgi:hypothetical protein